MNTMKKIKQALLVCSIMFLVGGPTQVYAGSDWARDLSRAMRDYSRVVKDGQRIMRDVGKTVGFVRSGGMVGDNKQSRCSGSQQFVEHPDGSVSIGNKHGSCIDTSRQSGWGRRPWQ